MSKNKKYNYSSPITNGVLSGFSTGVGFESAKLLLPTLFNQPKQEKDQPNVWRRSCRKSLHHHGSEQAHAF